MKDKVKLSTLDDFHTISVDQKGICIIVIQIDRVQVADIDLYFARGARGEKDKTGTFLTECFGMDADRAAIQFDILVQRKLKFSFGRGQPVVGPRFKNSVFDPRYDDIIRAHNGFSLKLFEDGYVGFEQI